MSDSSRRPGGQPRYSDEQVAWVLAARYERALEYRAIAAEFVARFAVPTTAEQMRHLVRARGVGSAAPAAAPAEQAGRGGEQEVHPLASFTRDAFREATPIAGDGVYFVTAATPITANSEHEVVGEHHVGRNVVGPFLHAIRRFCHEFDGTAVVLPMRAHMPALRAQPSHYDPALLDAVGEGWLTIAAEVPLNENLTAMDLYLNPQQAAPLTGLTGVRGRAAGFVDADEWRPIPGNASLFVAHTKQDLELVATGVASAPRMIHTTGAVTAPEYLKNRVGRIAHDDHVVGGLVVVVRGEHFWVQAVEAHPVDGSFCVGPYRVSGSAVEHVRVQAAKLGDLHPGHDDIDALRFEREFLDTLRPKVVVVEDWLDGQSISHHLEGRHLDKHLARNQFDFSSLGRELTACHMRLSAVALAAEGDAHLLLTHSNHPDHVRRWLNEGRYVKDPENYAIGHRMIVDILDGHDPVLRRAVPPPWRMLGEDEELFVEGYQYAMHGHAGVNGAKGSPGSLRRHFSRGVSAHTHVPSKRGRWLTAGHSSAAKHGYNEGPSTWLVAHVVTYAGGQSSHIMRIAGSSILGELPAPKSVRDRKEIA